MTMVLAPGVPPGSRPSAPVILPRSTRTTAFPADMGRGGALRCGVMGCEAARRRGMFAVVTTGTGAALRAPPAALLGLRGGAVTIGLLHRC